MAVHQFPDVVPESGSNGGSRPAVVSGTDIVRRYGEADIAVSSPLPPLVAFTVVAVPADASRRSHGAVGCCGRGDGARIVVTAAALASLGGCDSATARILPGGTPAGDVPRA